MTLDVGLQGVCPIHLHPRLLISSSGGIWLVSLQRSVLLMVTDQRIRWPESTVYRYIIHNMKGLKDYNLQKITLRRIKSVRIHDQR